MGWRREAGQMIHRSPRVGGGGLRSPGWSRHQRSLWYCIPYKFRARNEERGGGHFAPLASPSSPQVLLLVFDFRELGVYDIVLRRRTAAGRPGPGIALRRGLGVSTLRQLGGRLGQRLGLGGDGLLVL